MITLLRIALICTLYVSVIVAQSAEFTKGPNLNAARMEARSMKFADGRVAVFGGHGYGFVRLNTVGIYNPSSNTFSEVSLQDYRDFSGIARLQDGKIFLAGGMSSDLGVGQLASTEIFNPATNTSTAGPSMPYVKTMATAATLKDGKVLIVGCWYDNTSATYASIYDPVQNTIVSSSAVGELRANPCIVSTDDGKALVFAGSQPYGGSPAPETVELFDNKTYSFSQFQASLFTGETGWAPRIDFYQNDPLMMKLKDGKYVFLACKDSSGITKFKLFTIDPATKAIAKLETTPSLPNYNPVAGDSIFFYQPVVDTAKSMIFMLCNKVMNGATASVMASVSITSHQFQMYRAEYISHFTPAQGAVSILNNGKLFYIGGYVSSNFDAVDNTFFVSVDAGVGVEQENAGVRTFDLLQNYPNPFNPDTKITYQIAKSGFVTLKVFNVLGKEVATLVNEEKNAGEYKVGFNASQLSSGIYFYRLESGSNVKMNKMLLLK